MNLSQNKTNMKKDYLIVVDLDGTLLNHYLEVDMKSVELLKELKKTNKVVIATGRPLRSSIKYYKLLELDTPIINYNGALIQNPVKNDFEKFVITVDKNIVINLINDMKDHLLNLFCEIEDDIFLWKQTDEVLPYLHLEGGNLIVGKFHEILNGEPNGAILITKPGSAEIIDNYIKDKYNGEILIRFWGGSTVYEIAELYSKATSKGMAIEMVSKHLGIEKDKIIAIGDGHNDIEMIEYAEYGVAMGNANPLLKEVAKYHTTTLAENGVYKFLKDFFKI